MEFTLRDRLPDGFLSLPPRRLIEAVPTPTLFDLPGREARPLFMSVLLHGNEETGLLALQEVLRQHAGQGLPRRVLIFVGNVAAAAKGVRTLPGQSDFNRVWPGTRFADGPEVRQMRAVWDYAAAAEPFASIDIHNNTGLNPHYACVNRLDHRFFHLARLFSRTVVFFEEPVGVQSMAMARLCPAVTVECGHIGDLSATAHAVEFIEACLHLKTFPAHDVAPGDIDLLQTVAVVKVPPDVTFSFDGGAADIRFRGDLDHLNFSELPAGTPLGEYEGGDQVRLTVIPGEDADAQPCLSFEDGTIRFARPAIPSMLTRDPNAVRLDCLCYLMQRIGFDGRRVDP